MAPLALPSALYELCASPGAAIPTSVTLSIVAACSATNGVAWAPDATLFHRPGPQRDGRPAGPFYMFAKEEQFGQRIKPSDYSKRGERLAMALGIEGELATKIKNCTAARYLSAKDALYRPVPHAL